MSDAINADGQPFPDADYLTPYRLKLQSSSL